MIDFNRQLQEYLERALRTVAAETLLQRGGADSSGTGSKATLGLLRDELQGMKQVLEKVQEEQATKQEVLGAKEDIAKAQDAMRQELKLEMALAAEAQEQRMAALEAKMDAPLELLASR